MFALNSWLSITGIASESITRICPHRVAGANPGDCLSVIRWEEVARFSVEATHNYARPLVSGLFANHGYAPQADVIFCRHLRATPDNGESNTAEIHELTQQINRFILCQCWTNKSQICRYSLPVTLPETVKVMSLALTGELMEITQTLPSVRKAGLFRAARAMDAVRGVLCAQKHYKASAE